MKKGSLRSIIVMIVAGLFTSIAPQVRGDSDIYWTFGEGFDPSTVVVSPNEPVNWWNFDPFNFDVLLTLEGYAPYLLGNGTGVWTTFDTPGTYGFSSDDGDQGSVIVNLPPEVTITNPVNSAVFTAPATFAIEADVSETSDDSIVHVEFFVGTGESTNSIADDYETPFNASVTNLAAGTYALIAVATDARGWSGTNAITVSVTVVAPTAINLSAPRMLGGQFLLDVAGLTIGKTNVLQTSTNLTNWTPIKTNVAAAASATVTNTASSGAHLYRVLQWP